MKPARSESSSARNATQTRQLHDLARPRHGAEPDDIPVVHPSVGRLVDAGRDVPEFVDITSGPMRINHPTIGRLDLRFDASIAPGDPDQLLVTDTADPGSTSADPGSTSADRLSAVARRLAR